MSFFFDIEYLMLWGIFVRNMRLLLVLIVLVCFLQLGLEEEIGALFEGRFLSLGG